MRCLSALALAGAILAGCGSSSGIVDPISPLHLSSVSGPLPSNESIHLSGISVFHFDQCDDLWGYLQHHQVSIPNVSGAELTRILSTGNRVRAQGDRASNGVLNAYLSACSALFS